MSLNDFIEQADRAEQRADRLQLKMDEQSALVATLRRQLRESSQSTQVVSQQVRALQGVSHDPNTSASSVVGLQRTVATLRDRLDLEKKSANAAQAERSRLEQRLATGSRERQTLIASQGELKAELARRTTELDRANAALKESGDSNEAANGQVSSLNLTRTRERMQLEKEITELRAQLELEKRRATNRATRAAAAEAALRRAREQAVAASSSGAGAGGGAAKGGSEGSSVHAGSSVPASSCSGPSDLMQASEAGTSSAGADAAVDFGFGGGRAMDFDVCEDSASHQAHVPPSTSVAGVLASLESERSRRIDAEGALARAEAEHAVEAAELRASLESATTRADSLESQLERKGIEAGGAGARAALRVLERQLDTEKGKATAAEAREREVNSQMRAVLASLCQLAETRPHAAGPTAELVVQEQLARETIRDLAKSSTGQEAKGRASEVDEAAAKGTDAASASVDALGGDGRRPTIQRELQRCLQLIERRIRAHDAGAESAPLLLEKQRAAALGELSGSAEQAQPRRRASTAQPGLGRAERATRAASAAATSFAGRVARASAAAESRAAAAFEARLAGSIAQSQTAATPMKPKPGPPAEAFGANSPRSPRSPRPLSREQIKTQCLERLYPKSPEPQVYELPREAASTMAPPAATSVSRPSTAGRGRGGRRASLAGRGAGSLSGAWR